MALDKNDIDAYLYQLTERVERLEECLLIEDKFDKRIQEQLEITKDCLKKQREWNQTAQEMFDLYNKQIKLLGGNDD